MEEKVTLAIAGLGLIGQRHAEVISRMDGVALAAIVDPDVSARQAAAPSNIPGFDTLGEMFDRVAVDGVILATPNALHLSHGMTCIQRRCPILVEKPIATSAREAEALNEAAERQNVPVLVGHHRRHNPLIRKAKALIEAGEIGVVRAVQATCWFYKPDTYFDVAPWRKQKGAGPVAVNLAHDVDLMRYFCGEVRRVQATAAPSMRGYENEDVASAVLEFDTGAIGTISVSDSVAAPWSWEMTAAENPVYPVTKESCYQFGGTLGSLSLPDLRVWKHEGTGPDWWAPIAPTRHRHARADPLENQIMNFADVIKGNDDPVVSGREGQATLRVLEAIMTAASTGRAVDLPPREKT